jgi:GH24 family phage-related lysozyme (muramidase)
MSDPIAIARKMLIEHEGTNTDDKGVHVPYKDTEGYWTIGRGHKIPGVKKNAPRSALPSKYANGWTTEQTDAQFDKDLLSHAKEAAKIPGYSKGSVEQQAALIDLYYNTGPGGLAKFPNMLAAIEEGKWDMASKELMVGSDGVSPSKYSKDVGPDRSGRISTMLAGKQGEGFDSPQPQQQDLMLAEAEQVDLYDQEPEVEEPRGQAAKATTALRVASLSDNPVMTYQEALASPNPEAALVQAGRDLANAGLAQAVENMALQGQPPSPEDVDRVIEEDREKFSRQTAPEHAYAEQVEGYNDLSDDQQKQMIADLYVNRKISELLPDSFLGWGSDIVGMIAVADESYNAAAFWEELTGDTETFRNYLGSEEIMGKLSTWFSQLTPEEKVDVVDKFIVAAQNADDNQVQQVLMLFAATGGEDPLDLRLGYALDKFGAATTVTGVGRAVSGIVRAGGVVKTLAKLKKTSEAAVVADSVVTGKIHPLEAQTHVLDAAYSGLPVVRGELGELLTGAPEGVATEVRRTWAKMDALQEEGKDIVVEGLDLSDAEKAKVLAREEKRLEGLADIENVEFKVADDGIEISYTGVDSVTGEPLPVREVVKYKQSDITEGFEQTELSGTANILNRVASPNAMFNKIAKQLVQPFELAATSSAKLRSKMTDALRVATKELDKKGLTRVAGLIQRGTLANGGAGEVYKYTDAVHTGIGGVRYTDAEYRTYLNLRKLYDDMWLLKNNETRQTLELRGAKSVYLSNGQEGFASVADTPANAWKKYENSKYRNVLDDATGDIVRLDKEAIDAAYEEGKQLVKLDNASDFWHSDNARTKFALVSVENVTDLPPKVLGYRTGYSPLIYKNANFFVKTRTALAAEGTGASYLKTNRVFDNFTDAEAWAKKHAAENNLEYGKDVLVPFNRESISPSDMEEDVINMYGGFAKSPRASERLRFGAGEKGEEAEFVDPIEALQQYMFHVGNRLPVTQLRAATEQRWLNNAKEVLGDSYRNDFDMMYDVVKGDTSMDSAKRNFLVRSHEQIQTLNHIPTKAEQQFQGAIVSLGKSIEKSRLGDLVEKSRPALKGASKWLYTLSDKNPVGAAKAATHHMFLGTLSLAQYPVQALGATIAMSINPVYASKGMGKWLAFSALDNIRDTATRQKWIEKLSKTKGLNLENLEEAYGLWRKSGYRDSALITGGDYSTVANGLPYDGNLISRLADKSAFAFKAGELTNMRISFATAYERWKDMNKGKAVDDAALKEIFARAENFRLNMSQGNKAWFQKGAISVPLQFQQINTKFAEAMLGNTFTGKEKASLIAGQTILFGAIGFPLGEMALSYFYDAAGVDPGDLSENTILATKNGLMGWAVNGIMDIDAEVTGRVAVAGGISDVFTDMLFEQHDLTGLLGPTGGVIDRITDGFGGLVNATKLPLSSDDLSMSDAVAVAAVAAQSLLEVPSGTRNMLAALDLYQSGMVRDKFGKPMWQTDPDKWDILAQAMGFQSKTKQEFWDLMAAEKDRAALEKAQLDRLTWAFTRAMRVADDPEQSRIANLLVSHLYSSIDDPETARRLAKSLRERFRNNDRLRELVDKHLKNYSDKFTPASSTLNLLPAQRLEGNE